MHEACTVLFAGILTGGGSGPWRVQAIPILNRYAGKFAVLPESVHPESTLPRLRAMLDVMSSPLEDKPGLLIRDPMRFSDYTLIVPPGLLECLEYFDGAHTALDLREFLVRASGQLDVGGVVAHLVETLSTAGFLEDEQFAQARHQAERAFADARVRE